MSQSQNQRRNVHRALGFLSFLIPFITYYLTSWPSVSSGESGTLASAAYLQGVLDAPGAPLWVIVAGAFAHIIPGDPVRLLIFFSALCGGLTALVVYLTTTALNDQSLSLKREKEDSIGGGKEINLASWGGVIAALSFAWLDSQWTNATEISVHSAGTLLAALSLWAGVQWYQTRRAGKENAILWLLLGALCIGLIIGVDRTALPLLPGIALLIWLVQYIPKESDYPQHLVAGLLAMVGLLLLWQVVITDFFLLALLISLVVALTAALFPYLRRGALTATFGLLFILLGYTTYVQVEMRALAEPPVQFAEMYPLLLAPATFDYLWQFPELDSEPQHEEHVHSSPSLRYTIGHAYTRYLLWNFVGRVSNVKDAPALLFSASESEQGIYIQPSGREDTFPIKFYGLPLLLALIGFIWHFRHDWRTALVFTTMFLALGPLLVLRLGPGDPLSNEIDRFVVPSFLILTIWIGIAAKGLAEYVRGAALAQGDIMRAENIGMGMIVLCFIIAPLNLVWNGWSLHNQSHNYLPRDFAYNILESCDSNAILLVSDGDIAGHLSSLQDVEGVRRDVRAVEIDRLGDWWYRNQLSRESAWGVPPIPLSVSSPLTKFPLRDKVDSAVKVPLHIARDTSGLSDTIWWSWRGVEGDSGMMLYTIRHQIIKEIVEEMSDERPLYFAITTLPRWWSGLEEFFRWEGLTLRVVPERELKGIEGFSEFAIDHDRMLSLFRPDGEDGFLLRGLNDPESRYGVEDQGRVHYYRRALLALAADALRNRENSSEAIDLLNALDKTILIEIFPMPYWKAATVAMLYHEAGNVEGTERYAGHAIEEIEKIGSRWKNDPVDRQYNPYQTRARMYRLLGDYDAAIESYRSMKRGAADPVVRGLIEELRVERYLVKKDTVGAIRELRAIIAEYGSPNTSALESNLGAWKEMLEVIEQ